MTCAGSSSRTRARTARSKPSSTSTTLDDRALVQIGRIIHEADLEDERFDAPEARGLDVIIRGLSMLHDDPQMLELTGPLYDGLYEYLSRATVLADGP